MANRTVPYPSFNYVVLINGPGDLEGLFGGFSEVSGLGYDREIDVTLKRGVVNAPALWDWISSGGIPTKRDVVITLRDEANNPVTSWKLTNAAPTKCTGPTLLGKGGGDVAIEELVLAAEAIEIAPGS